MYDPGTEITGFLRGPETTNRAQGGKLGKLYFGASAGTRDTAQ